MKSHTHQPMSISECDNFDNLSVKSVYRTPQPFCAWWSDGYFLECNNGLDLLQNFRTGVKIIVMLRLCRAWQAAWLQLILPHFKTFAYNCYTSTPPQVLVSLNWNLSIVYPWKWIQHGHWALPHHPMTFLFFVSIRDLTLLDTTLGYVQCLLQSLNFGVCSARPGLIEFYLWCMGDTRYDRSKTWQAAAPKF